MKENNYLIVYLKNMNDGRFYIGNFYFTSKDKIENYEDINFIKEKIAEEICTREELNEAIVILNYKLMSTTSRR